METATAFWSSFGSISSLPAKWVLRSWPTRSYSARLGSNSLASPAWIKVIFLLFFIFFSIFCLLHEFIYQSNICNLIWGEFKFQVELILIGLLFCP